MLKNTILATTFLLVITSCDKKTDLKDTGSTTEKKADSATDENAGYEINGEVTSSDIAQSINREVWEEKLNAATQKKVGIEFPIFKVYEFTDSRGPALVVLTESNESKNAKGEPENTTVSAFMLRGSDGNFIKEWENTHDMTKDFLNEKSIWYWSKYCETSDADKDGESETVLVYGTSGMNGFDDGRVFIEIYYKGNLVSIEHQNGVKDMERITSVSPAFYKLPTALQDKVKYKMKQMVTAKQAIFPNNWEQKMAKKSTIIREN